MKSINLPESELSGMRQFYQEELDKTLRKLQHIKSVLEQLGDTGQSIEISVSGKNIATSTTSPAVGTEAKAKVAPKRKYRKKAGRKAMWGPVILKRMAQINRPLTYDELTDEIMEFSHLAPEKRPNTKAAVVNVTFRLRTKDKKINTFSNGSREKYLALNAWFDEAGEIKEEFRNKLPKVAPKIVKPKGKRGRPRKAAATTTVPATPKRRGRPKKVATTEAKTTTTPKKRGRPSKAAVSNIVTAVKTAKPAKRAGAKKQSKSATPVAIKVAKKASPVAKTKATPKKAATVSKAKTAPKAKPAAKTVQKNKSKSVVKAAPKSKTTAKAAPKAPISRLVKTTPKAKAKSTKPKK